MTHATVSPVSSLASRLRDNSTVVLDASYYLAAAKRDARAEYLAGHIPGAVFFDIDALSDTATSLPHMLLPPDQFAAADFGNGVSWILPRPEGYQFINPDLTIYLHRLPRGEWVCLEAVTHAEPNGVGLAESRLWDETGPLGRSLQSLLIDRGL